MAEYLLRWWLSAVVVPPYSSVFESGKLVLGGLEDALLKALRKNGPVVNGKESCAETRRSARSCVIVCGRALMLTDRLSVVQRASRSAANRCQGGGVAAALTVSGARNWV